MRSHINVKRPIKALSIVQVIGILLAMMIWALLTSFVLGASTMTWKQLGDLDLSTDKKRKTFEKDLKKKVSAIGFMVPLKYDGAKVFEFILTQSPPGCFHGPPPGPKEMILVSMKEGVEYLWDPVKIEGHLALDHDTLKKDIKDLPVYTMKGVSITKVDSAPEHELALKQAIRESIRGPQLPMQRPADPRPKTPGASRNLPPNTFNKAVAP